MTEQELKEAEQIIDDYCGKHQLTIRINNELHKKLKDSCFNINKLVEKLLEDFING